MSKTYDGLISSSKQIQPLLYTLYSKAAGEKENKDPRVSCI